MSRIGAFEACPVCKTALAAAHTESITDRRCPRCEAELWVLAFASGPRFFVRRPGESPADVIVSVAGPDFRASSQEIDSFLRGADRLDIVEFLGELEAELNSRLG
jgi:hypothetical protein